MTIGSHKHRTIVFPAHGRDQERRRREAELSTRLARLREAVRAATGTDLQTCDPGGQAGEKPPAEPAEIVTALTRHCIERLRDIDEDSVLDSGAKAEQLSELVVDLQQLALDLYRHDLSVRTRRLADCSAALARLRSLPSSADLLDQVCKELVERCGFGRAVLSRVEDGIWKPWMAHFSVGEEFESWFIEWIDQGIPLDEAPLEKRLLTERRPALIYDTATMPVYQPIIVKAGRSKSYVVAPVTGGPDVVGFLHADHYPSPKRTDEVDRDVLWAFAVGFGHIYERMVLMERLSEQRDHIREVLSSSVQMMDEIRNASIDLVGGSGAPKAAIDPETAATPIPIPGTGQGDGNTVVPPATPAVLGALTKRETEVLDLMIAGATNSAIAERLIITEDTVKSHVKRILRKLGVTNRSQAIAISLGLTPPGDSR